MERLLRVLRHGSLTSTVLPSTYPTVGRFWFSSAAATSPQREVVQVLRLNNLRDNPGAIKKKRRVGRGIGSSKGKTSGRGHKVREATWGLMLARMYLSTNIVYLLLPFFLLHDKGSKSSFWF